MAHLQNMVFSEIFSSQMRQIEKSIEIGKTKTFAFDTGLVYKFCVPHPRKSLRKFGEIGSKLGVNYRNAVGY